MSTRIAFVTALLFAATASAPLAAPVRRAGEWWTVINGGAPLISCFQHDEAMDQKSVMRPMARMPGGGSCKMNSLTTVGATTTYSVSCAIGGGVMTTGGTTVATGPDAFTSRMHSHGGVIPMGGGRSMAMPDTDMTIVSQRLGPCRPGDRVNPY